MERLIVRGTAQRGWSRDCWRGGHTGDVDAKSKIPSKAGIASKEPHHNRPRLAFS